MQPAPSDQKAWCREVLSESNPSFGTGSCLKTLLEAANESVQLGRRWEGSVYRPSVSRLHHFC